MTLRRRPLLAWLAAAGAGRAAAAASADLRQIVAAGPASLAALTAGGELWTLPARGTSGRRLGDGLDPATPPTAAYGRLAARRRDGALWVHEAGRVTTSPPASLAPEAGLLVLPAGIIGIAAAGGSHRVVRFDPSGAGWERVAISDQAVLPDARPLQADLDGRGDGGHLVLLGGPDGDRYRHGVLGDAVEATRVLLLERHGLTPMRELAIDAPQVIEDIAPHRVALDGRDGLLTVLSGPQGGQLALIDADPARPRALRVAARGDALGTPHRWMAPASDGRHHWLAVHTPHLAGTLHAYRREGERLIGRAVDDDVANHRLGSRRLDTSAWLGPRLLMPARSGHRLHWLDGAAGWRRLDTVELPARVADLVALAGAGCVAALLDDGSLRWIDAPS
ncbi:MAG: hypothetical protein KF788_15625 [Piscinibacter sp.]|nr:hypothetical protein [Piscinibacter sp.]